MASFQISQGDRVVIWVRDRSLLSAGSPLSELRDCFHSVGLSTEIRNDSSLASLEVLFTREPRRPELYPLTQPHHPDSFLLEIRQSWLRLSSSSRRGLNFAIWDLLERMGWFWPTPQITREPTLKHWEFPEGQLHSAPALNWRILYAEQTNLTPAVIRWLAKLRLNTLFPSNPAHFVDPDIQLPDESLETALSLGFDLILGGDLWNWIALYCQEQDQEIPVDVYGMVTHALRLWDEMSALHPRLAYWEPHQEHLPTASEFLSLLLHEHPEFMVQTDLTVPVPNGSSDQTLLHFSDQHLPLNLSLVDFNSWLDQVLGQFRGTSPVFYMQSPGKWDFSLGNVISPLLWKWQVEKIQSAISKDIQGGCLTLAGQASQLFLERSGFSYLAGARAFWEGPHWNAQSYVQQAITHQFDSAADSLLSLIDDLESWLGRNADPFNNQPLTACQVLHNEHERDLFYQRICEIEESPPIESSMELARALSTLVGLSDMEECNDPHESRALARTIWNNAMIGRWPRWLQKTSPLAEYLRPYL